MAISFMKSLSLRGSSHDGYINTFNQKPDTVSDSEDEDNSSSDPNNKPVLSTTGNSYVGHNVFDSSKQGTSLIPHADGPFSFLTPSMWPQDLLAAFSQPEDSHPAHKFDEYGFIIAKSNEEKSRSKLPEDPEEGTEEEKLRNKWIAYLEFTYNEAVLPKMMWSQVEPQIRHTRVLDELVKGGLPGSMRAQLWLRFSKGMALKNNSKWTYAQMCDQSNHVGPIPDKQILNVLPNNACFMDITSVGIERLRRILRVIKWLHRSGSNPLSTSCDSVNIPIIAAYLLLVCDEEDAFWLTLSCLNELKAFDHQRILIKLIVNNCSYLDDLLKKDDLDITLITCHWFSSLFAGFIPKTFVLFLFWDLYFYYGSIVLFQLTIGLLLETRHLLTDGTDAAIIFNRLSDLPSNITCQENLLSYWKSGAQYVDYIKKDMASINLMNLNTHGASFLALPSFTSDQFDQDIKSKNIRQTSILMELHEAIVAIGKHFESYDHNFKANLEPDYSKIDRDDFDYEEGYDNYKKAKNQLRRAKALIDFQRHDSDELGFSKNDIITIINERDEHCWIGELNGQRGWFPAKFVELLDERHGEYSIAGDDRVVPYINDLVRGRFCSIFKAILFHGLRRTLFIAMHPWNVIETIVSSCIESDFNSVYSRLVLTRTFRLDEFARVLSPCEILYRSVAHINQNLEYEPMDVKLRSLVCVALNQKILHEWFSIICGTQPHILAKFYHNWSFVNSPVWKMIRAELKLLTQFSFNMNINAEVQENPTPKSPVSKEGVKDMLVKHHLFSWDI
ncbi:small G protein signaling modulator 3 [Tetranychus urticae]|uniref:RUN and TBC1 domain-containing protein 3 n=1 Tax=Tetranychus urticae TaxID=32264 RepID=T1KNL3_TETUR|nr:small G protein signaling modulator 3 [Tetranychus urticae]